MNTNLIKVLVVAASALTLTACSSTDVDAEGRWVGGGKVMTTWADAHVPSSWDRTDQSVTYEDLIDDFGKDTGRDRTKYSASFRGVTEQEFEEFGEDGPEVPANHSCEPFDPALATDDEKPSVKTCYLDLSQGALPEPNDFDLFAAWTLYPDGSTETSLWLSNDPH